MMFLSLD